MPSIAPTISNCPLLKVDYAVEVHVSGKGQVVNNIEKTSFFGIIWVLFRHLMILTAYSLLLKQLAVETVYRVTGCRVNQGIG